MPQRPLAGSEASFISLDGSWDMWLGPCDDALAGHPPERTIDLPANWWLRGVDHSGKATFARTFHIDASASDKLWRLCFEGVDYYCRVWLDGELLGSHEGYFEPFWFDLAGLTAGSHRLVVEVDSPHEPWGSVWHMHKTLLKGVFGHHDARPGAAWSREGQARNSGGIWAPITLEAWPDQVMIDSVVVRALPADPDHADVDLCGTLCVAVAAPSAATVTLTLTGANDFGQMSVDVALPASPEPSNPESANSAATATVDFEASARLPLADRWTTWCRGEPKLYDAQVTVTAKNSDRSAKQYPKSDTDSDTSLVLAERKFRTGVRSCSVDDSYRWCLNGEEIWIRGTNYIGTYWPTEYTEQRMRQDLQLIRDAGINQVRVHAHVVVPKFYEIADELGLTIWQDFPLQWGYTDDPAFHQEAHRQMRAMIRLLGSHPSIVAWCCHNESPWDAPWMADEFGGTHDPDHNRRLDKDLEDIARDVDPSRYVHRNSGTGDSHHYAGWYFGHWQDFAARPGGPFVTEYGSLAPPDVSTLREIIPSEAHGYDSAEARRVWAFHDFQHRETKQHIKVLPSDGLERYVAAAQAYQANLIQAATESFRRGKARQPGGLPADGGPLITGVHHFMAVEGWEALTWAVLDHNRKPKPGYHALSRAMAPLLVCVELLDSAERPDPRPRAGRAIIMRFWLINDLPQPVSEATLLWSMRPVADPTQPANPKNSASKDSTLANSPASLAEGSLPVAGAAADSALILGEAKLRAPHGWHRVELRLTAANCPEPLATNHLDFEVRR